MLLLFDAPSYGYISAKILVRDVPGHVVQEPLRLELGAVHEYDAHLGVRIGSVFVVRARIYAVAALKGFQFAGFFLEWIECHILSNLLSALIIVTYPIFIRMTRKCRTYNYMQYIAYIFGGKNSVKTVAEYVKMLYN